MFGGLGLGAAGIAFKKEPHEPLGIKGPPDKAGADLWGKAFPSPLFSPSFYSWRMKSRLLWKHPKWKPGHWNVSYHDGDVS